MCESLTKLDFRRLPGEVFDPPSFGGDECGLIFPNRGLIIEPNH